MTALLLTLLSITAPVTDDPALPPALVDPAFARHVDLALVRQALTTRNSVLLADVTLQLMEGERILLRSHKGLPAVRMFKLALAAAVEQADKPTLDRLERAATTAKRSDLQDMIPAARLLTAKGRRLDAGVGSGEGMSVEAVLLLRSFQEQLKVATALNDRARLTRLEKGINALPELTGDQRSALRKQVAEAIKATGEGDDDGDDLLRKLAASARSAKVVDEKLKK